MLYHRTETETSQQQLKKIFTRIKGETCLLGGWAVYYLVNKNFEKATGRNYIGSRDIDLGFHIDKKWNKEQLENSDFATTIKTLEDTGFNSVSFRLIKDFNMDNGKELTPQESARLPIYQIFQLYIDPIVDHIHPDTKNLLGFVPIDEPLLSLVFQEKKYSTQPLFGKRVMLPEPLALLAMKINSAPKREKENKLIKDIADIYALLWYSDTQLSQLKEQLLSIIPKEQVTKTTEEFSKDNINRVATILGVDAQEIQRVLREIT
jgi:hypothetical protein